MSDNLGVRAFSSPDEGTDFPLKARLLVLETVNKDGIQQPLTRNDVYVVWFGYTLGAWKALVSTKLPDGRYYEVTYQPKTGQVFVDVYQKLKQDIYQID